MNHVRACLYLWALFAAGTAFANEPRACECIMEKLVGRFKCMPFTCTQCQNAIECPQKGITTRYECHTCKNLKDYPYRHTHGQQIQSICPACVELSRETR
ncbi:uncharacterized protein MELLADRAFT_124460 [Melampsora larici-populina 98AG31]|uniref:Secreted protein n=1 Tax=Melampsora larici-populina (strain 98AG31 / pathotype 3-4-7) TaxID=747676 RepID=F4RK19_MELLP|nr:uncharacterized protein MELLADRAFT_124460 [Melampsora larici-populina 98AG31]EGG07265.1 secreted protein [Melampsora larici-populina 98AG31]